jgi:hypothetical protein
VLNGNTNIGGAVSGTDNHSILFGNMTTQGTYTVVATNVSTGCTSTMGSATITAGTPPTVSVNSAAVCGGAAATITATPSPAGSYNYVWSVPAGASDPGNVPSFSATVQGYYGVTITNAIGCSGTGGGSLSAASGPSVTVNSPYVCAGGAATITATASPAGSYNYVWTVPQGASNPGNVPSFSASVQGYYGVTVTSAGGCSSTAGGTLTTGTGPSVSVNSPSRCSTGSAVLVTATVSPAGSYNYVWSVPAGAPNPGNVPSFNASIAGTYSVTVSLAGGCPGTGSGLLTVYNGAPMVAAITGNAGVCRGFTTALSDATPGGIWSSSNTAVATVVNGVVTGVSNGTTTISYTVTNGCGTRAVGLSFTVADLPQVAPITGSTTVCPSAVIQLSDATSGGIWSSDNTAIATVNFSGKVTGISNGTVTIRYTVNNICGPTVRTVQIIVSCNKNGKNGLGDSRLPFMDVQVLPNPSINYFNLIVSSSEDDAPTVRVFDMQGRLLDEKRGAIGQAIRIGDGLAAGTYVVQVIQGPNMKSLKIVKL